MTTITIELPDELARRAKDADIFNPEKLFLVLEKISNQESPHEYWQKIQANTPPNDLSEDEIMGYVDRIIHKARAESGATK